METIADLLFHAAKTCGDTRIYCPEGEVTYREIESETRRVAAGLKTIGVGPGDRVGLWLPNLKAYIGLYGACCRLGAIGVAMNTRFRRAEIEDVLRRARPKVVAFVPEIGRANHIEILREVDPELLTGVGTMVQCTGDPVDVPGVSVKQYADLAHKAPFDDTLGRPDSPCAIFTTSGTTSLPKLVLHNQAQVARHSDDVARVLEMEKPETMVLQSLPFCGVFGYVYLMATLRAGAPSVMPMVFEAAECAELMLRHEVTHVAGGDDMMTRLLSEGDQLTSGAHIPFPALRFCPYATFNSALADFPETAYRRGLPLVGPFGMSEVFSFFSLRRMDDPENLRPEGGGVPVNRSARVRVRDPETNELLGDGKEGELEMWSPNMFVGYYGNEDATREALTDDGYLRTGDLGTTQNDGTFTYLGRMGDVLRLGGFLVNPLEIETHLCAHSAVADAQVVGVGTERGNKPVAFVISEPDRSPDEDDLIAHCKAALAGFKIPIRIFLVDQFPTTPSPNGTKIQKGELRRMAEDALNSQPVTTGMRP